MRYKVKLWCVCASSFAMLIFSQPPEMLWFRGGSNILSQSFYIYVCSSKLMQANMVLHLGPPSLSNPLIMVDQQKLKN